MADFVGVVLTYRRRVKYKLARISEEDEEEVEAANEETPMMEESAFDDEDVQGPDVNMSRKSDPPPYPTADDTPTQPPSDDKDDDSEGTPVDDPMSESGPAAPITVREHDDRGADGDNNEDDSMQHISPPPFYKDPPPYSEAVRNSSAKSNRERQRQDTEDDLEWDQDQSVEPSIIVNPFDDMVDGSPHEAVELEEKSDAAEISPESGAEVETSYITPDLVRRYVQPMEIESQTANHSSRSDGFHVSFKDANARTILIMLFSVLIAIIAVLIVVLLPLTFSYVEYYELGLKRQRSTGQVFFDEGAFEAGRYPIGPDYEFKKYPSMATNVQMDDVAVTTTAGLSHSFSCSFQYFIREGELGLLEQRFDQGYHDVIEFVARSALKNLAATLSLSKYLEERRQVELMFHDALRAKLGGNCCPDREQCIREDTCYLCSNSTTDCDQGYHIDVPFFQLLMIDLPEVIIDRNLQVQLLNEQAEMEQYIQEEALTRKETERLTQDILNSAAEVNNNASAYANLIQSRGEAEARAKIEAANSNGLAYMYDQMGVVTDEHKASLHWLRTLEKQDNLLMGISFEEYLKLIKDYVIT